MKFKEVLEHLADDLRLNKPIDKSWSADALLIWDCDIERMAQSLGTSLGWSRRELEAFEERAGRDKAWRHKLRQAITEEPKVCEEL